MPVSQPAVAPTERSPGSRAGAGGERAFGQDPCGAGAGAGARLGLGAPGSGLGPGLGVPGLLGWRRSLLRARVSTDEPQECTQQERPTFQCNSRLKQRTDEVIRLVTVYVSLL